MHPLLPAANQLFSLLTILGQIILIGLGVFTLVLKRKEWPTWLEKIAESGILLAWIVATTAMLGSLFYSDVARLAPCLLCWYQRIAMYPQVFLLGLAWLRKDRGIIPYSIMLSAIGSFIAVYHYLLQLGVDVNAPCSAVGYSVSCSDRFVLNYGYITIPMMALTAFLMIIVFLRLQWLSTRQ